MNPAEAELAARFYDAINRKSNESERSQQSADFRIGMSDLGWCSELTRRMLAGIPEPPSDKLTAFIGTALGDHVEQAWTEAHPSALRHQAVSVRFQGEHGEYVIGGHPDLLLPAEGVVVDVKSTRGLAVPERSGPSTQQQFQRHGYALGAHQAGLFPDHELEELRVANIWMDRAGEDRYVHCQMEPYSEDVIAQAGQWIDDVVYAYLNGEEARKEPPRDMCAKVCGHFADCRGMESDVTGLIEDPELLAAIDAYKEGQQMESTGRRIKDQAKSHLAGISGSTGTHLLRWTWVNDSLVPEYTRKGYYKIDLKPIR